MAGNPWNSLVDFFYPPHCLVCKKPGQQVHSRCRGQLPFIVEPFCNGCGIPLPFSGAICDSTVCLAGGLKADQIRSVFRHTGGPREGVLRLKYRGVSSLAEWAVAEMAGAARRNGMDQAQGVLPVPLHARRLKERGYNQAGLLASGLADYLGLPFYRAQLVRTKETRSQVGLDSPARAENVKGAFEWLGGQLEESSLLLVDDVCTTGATLSECAKVLKKAGAGPVWGLTLTREI